ncbi:DUF5723 family protein [Zeaxanthinibacter sp. PT1]|uniref:DUF5723 family protein n=1 Tax=Zeaxanthinibacter TaxID=561554 RepID=UPI002349CDA8|nr:DUF5723 family protein [Zeaxanthinibacter sp. PT1]MDC6352368.1 DUF5723 family protein [Zeaxanthinibacter sp. PT1]
MKPNPKLLLIPLIGLMTTLIYAQSSPGSNFDNYGGIYTAIANPANIVDSKHKVDIGVAYNHLSYAEYGDIPLYYVEDPTGFNGIEYTENLDNDAAVNTSALADRDVIVSGMFSLNARHALAITARSRAFINYDDFNGYLWEGINSEFSQDAITIANPALNSSTHHWKEAGLSYALVLANAENHFLKFGGTFKYLMGAGATQLDGNLNGDYQNDIGQDDLRLDGSLNYINTFPEDYFSENQNNLQDLVFNSSVQGTGIGGDIGMVYEWRPRSTNRVDEGVNASALTKYKFRLSAAVLDLGTITYKDFVSEEFLINDVEFKGREIRQDNGLLNTLRKNTNDVTVVPTTGDAVVSLPTSLQLNFDVLLKNGANHYLNLNYMAAMSSSGSIYSSDRLNLATVSYRYETRNFSVYTPISYSTDLQEITGGIGMRLYFLTIGSATLSNLFMEGYVDNLFVGINFRKLEELF